MCYLLSKLKLIIVEMCKHIKNSVVFFNTLESLYVQFPILLSRNILISIQKQLDIKLRKIIKIIDSRWTCRFENCHMVKQYYTNSSLLEVVDSELEEDSDFNSVETE